MTICVHEVFVLLRRCDYETNWGKGIQVWRMGQKSNILGRSYINNMIRTLTLQKLYITVKNWGRLLLLSRFSQRILDGGNIIALRAENTRILHPSASPRGPMPACPGPHLFKPWRQAIAPPSKSLLTAHTSYPQLCNFWATLRGELVADEGPLLGQYWFWWACGCRGCRQRTSRLRIPEPKGLKEGWERRWRGLLNRPGTPHNYLPEVMTNGAHKPTVCLARPPCNWEELHELVRLENTTSIGSQLRYGAFESCTTSKGIQSDASMSKFFPLEKRVAIESHRKVQFR